MTSDSLFKEYHRIQKLEETLKKIFDKRFKTGLFVLKAYMLDHIVDDLEKFGILRVSQCFAARAIFDLVKDGY